MYSARDFKRLAALRVDMSGERPLGYMAKFVEKNRGGVDIAADLRRHRRGARVGGCDSCGLVFIFQAETRNGALTADFFPLRRCFLHMGLTPASGPLSAGSLG